MEKPTKKIKHAISDAIRDAKQAMRIRKALCFPDIDLNIAKEISEWKDHLPYTKCHCSFLKKVKGDRKSFKRIEERKYFLLHLYWDSDDGGQNLIQILPRFAVKIGNTTEFVDILKLLKEFVIESFSCKPKEVVHLIGIKNYLEGMKGFIAHVNTTIEKCTTVFLVDGVKNEDYFLLLFASVLFQ